ncbi:MAG: hypothetical protein ABJC19_12555, partial [Gemmatimonadota bacterium]
MAIQPHTAFAGACGGSGIVDPTCWPSSATITVSGDSSALNLDIGNAISKWQELLSSGAFTGAPQLVGVASGGDIAVIDHGVPTTSAWCGETPPIAGTHPNTIHLYASNTSKCASSRTGSRTTTILHELAHVLGYSGEHGGSIAGANALTANCVTFLFGSGGPGPIPTQVCRHEVEPIFRAYYGTSLEAEFFNWPIVFRSNLFPLNPDSLSIGDVLQLSLTELLWNDPNSSSTAGSLGVFAVQSTNSNVATVSPSGSVTAVSGGTAKVRVVPSSSTFPSGTTWWTPFLYKGDSVLVNVRTPPPPPPGDLQVAEITFDQVPVTAVGGHAGTVVLSRALQPSDSVTWSYVKSNQPAVSYGGSGVSIPFSVATGDSYNIRFSATA